MIGEIGGGMEEKTSDWIFDNKFKKPVTAFICGQTAPAETWMGHAGAIIS